MQNKILKRTLKLSPTTGNENDITAPIQIQFLAGDKIVSESEYSNLDFLNIIAGHEGIANFTGAKLILDDGKKSYTFTLDADQFVQNKTETGKAMK